MSAQFGTPEYIQENAKRGDELREERWEQDKGDRGSVRETIEQEFVKVKERTSEEREFEDALDERQELRERSGADLPKVVDGYAKLYKWGQQDPVAAAEWTADWALKQPEPKPGRETPKAESSGPRTIEDDLRHAVKAVKANAEDRAALSTLKELAPGQSPVETLREINRFDRDLRADPLGTVTRHAARAGVPVTPAQQARESHVQQLHPLIAAAEQALPNFSHLANDVVELLEDRNFQRSGDPAKDLFVAYELAEKRAIAANAKKAAVSLKGSGPAAQASTADGNGVRATVQQAMEQVR